MLKNYSNHTPGVAGPQLTAKKKTHQEEGQETGPSKEKNFSPDKELNRPLGNW